jgi:hypothetical protein
VSRDRIADLHQGLARIADARRLATTDVWAKAWTDFEQELLERLLKCGPEDDWERYRLQVAIEAARHVRRAVEHEARDPTALEKELEVLEGRKPRAIA